MNDIVKSDAMPGTDVATNAPMAGNLTEQLLARLGVEVVKQVTRTVLQQSDGVPFAVTFESAAIESEVATPARGGSKMAPARVCDVVNFETGAKQILIMNTVLEGELSRTYPDLGYVGKTFLIRSHFPVDGVKEDGTPKRKSYKVFEIIEIRVKGGEIEVEGVVADASDPVNKDGKSKK